MRFCVLLFICIGTVAESPFAIGSNSFSIVAVGDIQIGRHVMAKYPSGFDLPDITPSIFKKSEIVFGNLESCLSDSKKPQVKKRYTFKASTSSAHLLDELGFNVLSIANNHCMDFGITAVAETRKALLKNNIKALGAGKSLREAREPIILTTNGNRIGFLAFTADSAKADFMSKSYQGTAPLVSKLIMEDVKALRPVVDVLIVSLHWGIEGVLIPNDKQIELGHELIEAGVNLVIGHHPHVLQSIEWYQDGVIAYSLGNFIFDQTERLLAHSTESVALRISFLNKKISEVAVYPLVLRDYLPRRKMDDGKPTFPVNKLVGFSKNRGILKIH